MQYQDFSKSGDGVSSTGATLFSQSLDLSAVIIGNLVNQSAAPYSIGLDYRFISQRSTVDNPYGEEGKFSVARGFLSTNSQIELKVPRQNFLRAKAYWIRNEGALTDGVSYGGSGLRPIKSVSKNYIYQSGFDFEQGHERELKYYIAHSRRKDIWDGSVKEYEHANLSLQHGILWFHFFNEENDIGLKKSSLILGNMGLSAGSGNASRDGITGPQAALTSWYRLTNWLETVSYVQSDETRSGEQFISNNKTGLFLIRGKRSWWTMATGGTYKNNLGPGGMSESLYLPLQLSFTPDKKNRVYSASSYKMSSSRDSLGNSRESDSINQKVSWSHLPRRKTRLSSTYSYSNTFNDSGKSTDSHSGTFSFSDASAVSTNLALGLSRVTAKTPSNESIRDSRSIAGGLGFSPFRASSVTISASHSGLETNSGNETTTNTFSSSFSTRLIRKMTFQISADMGRTKSNEGALSSSTKNSEYRSILDYNDLKLRNSLDILKTESDAGAKGKKTRFSVKNDTVYKKNKYMQSHTSLNFLKEDEGGSSSTSESAAQTIKYDHYGGRFNSRLLYSIIFTGNISSSDSSNGASLSSYDYNLQGAYYLTRTISLSGHQSYHHSSGGLNETEFGAGIYIRYPLVTLSLSYDAKHVERNGIKAKENLLKLNLTKDF